MIRRLRKIIARVETLDSNQESEDRSRLVGMYMIQANRTTGMGMQEAMCREWQDGKFLRNRR